MSAPSLHSIEELKERRRVVSRCAVVVDCLLALLCPITLLIACSSYVAAQQSQANELLARALHLADLYNWADAASAFTEAEKQFAAAGDQRNALYARLGRTRANVERDQQTLPAVSAQLEEALGDDPLLQGDKELRMFCLIVKGDIDTETNTGAMRRDWEQVQTLAQDLGNTKWQYRALAQLGIAAFYDADLESATKDVGTALAAATKAGDAGAQIRFLTILAHGFVESKMYEQALAYVENAIKIAAATPDAGYQFSVQEARIGAYIGLNQLDAAQQVVDEVLRHAREAHRTVHEATALVFAADIDIGRNERQRALSTLQQAIALGEAADLPHVLAGVYARATQIYQDINDIQKAERSAELAAASTQASGDLWAVPQGLQALAELQVVQGKYAEADRVYDRAEAFLDSLIGNVTTALEKAAVITASSQIYAEHFALVAERFNDSRKAYAVVEQVRGRAAADLLAAGSVAAPEANRTERTISQLRLKLMMARSTNEVRNLRDQILMMEEARWITPDVRLLKKKPREAVGMERIQQTLDYSAVLLEYVIANPHSYCLAISRTRSHIVQLGSKGQIEALVTSYLKAVKAKSAAVAEARAVYDALLLPIREAADARTIIIVRDGQLHLVPFDGLRDVSGHNVVETQTVIYAPSASGFFLLTEQRHQRQTAHDALLAIGGIPYSRSAMNKSGLTKGNDRSTFADLPSSADEVRIAQTAFLGKGNQALLGNAATEAAFKSADLPKYQVIHFAVHGFADSTFPDRAALVLLSDPAAGEDGFLQASEIAQLRFDTDLVVLSACDTAVGPLQGQEGIANLSRAFLLAGARAVLSTLWQVDDNSSLFLMKRFYAHLSANRSPASALTAAKRDMLRTFGPKTPPYQWAGFTIEGAAAKPIW